MAGKLANRYARALLGAAKAEKVDLAELTEKLTQIAEAYASNKQLSEALLNPVFSKKDKWSAIDKISDLVSLPPIGKNFLRVVVERDRIGSIDEIAEAFSQEADRDMGVFRVEVTSAKELSSDEVSEIEAGFQKKVEGKPAFEWKIDPEILGGLIFQYEGRLVDSSVRGRLSRLEKELS